MFKIRIKDLKEIALTFCTCETTEKSRGNWNCGCGAQESIWARN